MALLSELIELRPGARTELERSRKHWSSREAVASYHGSGAPFHENTADPGTNLSE